MTRVSRAGEPLAVAIDERSALTVLKGVGPRVAEKFARLGLSTVQDLLFHLPLRYQDRTRVTPIGALTPGVEAVVVADVALADIVYRGRRSLLCRVSDGTGLLTLRFFHFSAAQHAAFTRGRRLRCFGEARLGGSGLEMIHPEYDWLDEGANDTQGETHLTPVYPTTEGVHQLTLRRLTQQALDLALPSVRDWVPPELLPGRDGWALADAIRFVHRPPALAATVELAQGRHPAQQRLAFEELLAHHLSLRRRRLRVRESRAPTIDVPGCLVNALLAALPFRLTGAQTRIIDEVRADLARPYPMQRLIQGDVGSGKTVVAAAAALHVVEAGLQAAVMAPTELLAEQHWRNLQAWFAPLDVEVAWLSGKLPARARRAELARIESGAAPVAVGTHALFQDDVAFRDLGLIVVDEQHRFGVHQRLALRAKGMQAQRQPHQLFMSATPIPRTLAQTLYADLDVSLLDELPPGRTPVETVVVPETRRADIVARVHEACRAGRQAYWVCALIEESEALDAQTVIDTAAALQGALRELRVGLVHGRMKPADKEAAMAAFKRHELDLLVATTVIEVGVDVPNASLMIIENAERLGLAQLHQLRGRVGRGAARSSCVLLYRAPLSELARGRLACLRDTNDGFEIARRDLEMRGPGEMFGARQAGVPTLHIADLVRDQALLPSVQGGAEALLAREPARADAIIRRWLGAAEDLLHT